MPTLPRAQADGTHAAPHVVVANFGDTAGDWRVDQHLRFLADTSGGGLLDIVGLEQRASAVSRALANGARGAATEE